MLAIGIDWGTYQHTVKFSPAPGTDETPLKIDNTYDGFLHLLDVIRRRSAGLKPEESSSQLSDATCGWLTSCSPMGSSAIA